MNDAQARGGIDRRGFLKLGAGGLAALTVLGGAAQLSGCSHQASAPAAGYQWLNADDLPLLGLLIAAVAGSAMPAAAADAQTAIGEGLRRLDLSCAALGGPAQKEVRKLLDLLHWGPFRRFAGGVATPWPQAQAEDMRGLLARFAASRLSLLNGAMRAMIKLGATAFWSQAAGSAAAHYPGPPAWAVAALNA